MLNYRLMMQIAFSPVKQIQDFALKHGIQSTPTIIFQNGNRVSGAIPLEEFKSLM
jgi:thiol:disulfide interchange protein DsbC